MGDRVPTRFVRNLQASFCDFVGGLNQGAPVAVACHSDVDGLAAGAILTRTPQRLGCTVVTEVTSKGENGRSTSLRERLARQRPQAPPTSLYRLRR